MTFFHNEFPIQTEQLEECRRVSKRASGASEKEEGRLPPPQWQRNIKLLWEACVNFTNIVWPAFLYKSVFAAFLSLQFGFVFFRQKEISAQAAQKMLVKLTKGGGEDLFFHWHKHHIIFQKKKGKCQKDRRKRDTLKGWLCDWLYKLLCYSTFVF